MIGFEYLGFYRSLKKFNLLFFTDYVDKLNHIHTPSIILCITSIVLSINMKDLNCFTVENPGLHAYLNSFCLSKGTIALLPHEDVPQTKSEWAKVERLYLTNHAQYIHVFISLLGILFMLPFFIWKMVCLGTEASNFNDLAESAHKASKCHDDQMNSSIDCLIQKYQQNMFIKQENNNDIITKFLSIYAKYLPILSFSRARGTWLTSWYFITKLFYIGNCLFVLFLMTFFVSYHNSSAFSILEAIFAYFTKKDSYLFTRTFPRTTFCYIPDHNIFGSSIDMTVQCIIPGSVIIEKLYIFLYLWVSGLVTLTILNTLKWTYLFLFTRGSKIFIRSLLCNIEKVDKKDIEDFVQNYLQSDGVLIIQFIEKNTNYIFLTRFMNSLYSSYLNIKQKEENINQG